MRKIQTKTGCDRCGTCCTRGGPALHSEDQKLLRDNRLSLKHLITIRKGEPVVPLTSMKPEPAESEIVKIKGRDSDWTCRFFIPKKSACAIYSYRPLECSLLKCWDTADLEKVAGKSLLSRMDLMAADDPILPLVKAHDEQCSLENLALLLTGLQNDNRRQKALTDLSRLVNNDLKFRSRVCEKLNLGLELELFYFGRPLFTILEQFGLITHMADDVCRLSLSSSFTCMDTPG